MKVDPCELVLLQHKLARLLVKAVQGQVLNTQWRTSKIPFSCPIEQAHANLHLIASLKCDMAHQFTCLTTKCTSVPRLLKMQACSQPM